MLLVFCLTLPSLLEGSKGLRLPALSLFCLHVYHFAAFSVLLPHQTRTTITFISCSQWRVTVSIVVHDTADWVAQNVLVREAHMPNSHETVVRL